MSSHQVSRRTLARGAAWTVPVVAIAVAAPAYAASQIYVADGVMAGAGAAWQVPGNPAGTTSTYKAELAFTSP